MGAVLLVLLIALLLGGLGFAVHVLWYAAVVLMILWIAGWMVGAAEGGGRRRWYGR